jgi:hypothetical protein
LGVRVLVDNCVPRRLARHIDRHDVSTVFEMGWADLKNGALLDAMTGRFDALITVDTSMRFQQRLHDRSFALVLLRAQSNRLTDLLPLIPALLEALDDIRPGEIREVTSL